MSELETDEAGQYFRKNGLVPLDEDPKADPDDGQD